MVEHAFLVREEVIEAIIERARRNEAIAVPDAEQVLAADGDARGAVSGDDNVVHEARQRRDAADEEGGGGPPIRCELIRVPVDAVEVVHVGHGDAAAAEEEVAGLC